jgi:hypothetical protein
MFGGLARNNTFTRSRHLSETNLKNFPAEKLTQTSQSPHQIASTITNKTSTNSKNSAMFSLPPQINSPLTTLL